MGILNCGLSVVFVAIRAVSTWHTLKGGARSGKLNLTLYWRHWKMTKDRNSSLTLFSRCNHPHFQLLCPLKDMRVVYVSVPQVDEAFSGPFGPKTYTRGYVEKEENRQITITLYTNSIEFIAIFLPSTTSLPQCWGWKRFCNGMDLCLSNPLISITLKYYGKILISPDDHRQSMSSKTHKPRSCGGNKWNFQVVQHKVNESHSHWNWKRVQKTMVFEGRDSQQKSPWNH